MLNWSIPAVLIDTLSLAIDYSSCGFSIGLAKLFTVN